MHSNICWHQSIIWWSQISVYWLYWHVIIGSICDLKVALEYSSYNSTLYCILIFADINLSFDGHKYLFIGSTQNVASTSTCDRKIKNWCWQIQIFNTVVLWFMKTWTLWSIDIWNNTDGIFNVLIRGESETCLNQITDRCIVYTGKINNSFLHVGFI